MNYHFRAAKSFWRSWSRLSEVQQRAARQAFPIFKVNPFDPRLRAHNLRGGHCGRFAATFYVEGKTVWSVSIGTHDLYKG